MENDETGERIPLERVNGTYVMKVNTIDEKGKKVTRNAEDEMDVDGMSDEDMEVDGEAKVKEGSSGEGVERHAVFRRRMF